MLIYYEDPQYSFQLLRTMGAAVGQAADIGECLKTAYRVEAGDDEGWYREWNKTAQQMDTAGAYLRACNYYRNSDFFLREDPANDPRVINSWKKSKEMFLKYADQQKDFIIKEVKIPFEDTTLPGYLCLIDDSGQKRPMVIIHSGFDGTKEELYYSNALPALKRGYNCLLFEGPGQGEVIRVQKIPFRYNWETVVTPVVDYALEYPEVDPDRIALMGISFGGYLAPRAVAFEKRIKVCIANGGVYDFHENFVKNFPPDFEKQLDDPQAAKEIDKAIYDEMKKNPNLRWVFNNGMWTFGAKTPSELIRKTRPYRMEDVAKNITCTMLIVDSEDDKDMPGQAKKLYDALGCPKEYLLFTKEEGAEEHCQMGAGLISSERIYNWLSAKL
ncbi:MAG: alpha/beta fold hydrolase [Candidatus Margulisbacteria bacterium]|nr:alpha/beta fold hydrolase [Candidatus Margulisiibacteriota bacterium]